MAIGLLWFGVYNVSLNAGERRVDAGTAALLIQVSPIMVAFLATTFLGERATRWLWIGSAVSFAGVALIATSSQGEVNRDPIGVLRAAGPADVGDGCHRRNPAGLSARAGRPGAA